MKLLKSGFTLFFVTIFLNGFSQDQLNQILRGTLIDADTKTPIIGAKITIPGTNPVLGAMSDLNGDYKIENVPVGRVAVNINAWGYLEVTLPSVLIESGKEKILDMEMTADIKVLTQIEVSSQKDRSQVSNQMALVSGKTFSVEETNRYAGSINDPARMVSAFAGVTSDAQGNNDIVVRGNSPRGILWRLDGIDIPNPNHFAENGGTGGPINALNGAVLANSDFFSGAFAPEYGNALSGVFDVKMRQGNNETREYTFSAGAMGIDATIEGPFSKNYRGSYMANYRYSSIALLDKTGLLDFGGIPIYQDAAFKLSLPTKRHGAFNFIGFGGKSKITQTAMNNETGEIYGTYGFKADVGVLGLRHTYIINPNLYVKSYLATTSSFNGGEGSFNKKDSILQLSEREGNRDSQIKAQTIFNYKANAKNIFQFGGTYTRMLYNFYYEDDYDNEDGELTPFKNANGQAGLLQSFASWKWRVTNEISFVSGLHYTNFLLNNSWEIEPRAAFKWQISPRHNVSAGIGKHSRLESASVYLHSQLQGDGSYYFPNKDLDFTKSLHFVVGYGFKINEKVHFKSEIYYQQLYNVPIAKDTTSNFSFLNYSSGVPDFEVVNGGKGRNYGMELTLERFFYNNFYYLVTGSIYKSEYQVRNEPYRNSRYDANFAGNLLVGKEFVFGKSKNKTFGLNTKISLIGGNRYTPIDLEASQAAGENILDQNNQWAKKGDNIFIMNLGLTYRCDMKRASHSLKIEVQNLTNNQAVIREYYNNKTGKIDADYQQSVIPNIIYTIKF